MKLYTMFPRFFTRGEIGPLTQSKRDFLQGWDLRVVSLTTRPDQEVARFLEDRFFHHPLADGRVDEQRLDDAVQRVLGLLESGERVIVHCHAGRNRAGLVAAMVTRSTYGLTGEEAMQHVRRVRPRAIANPHFERYLMGLGRP